MYTACCSRLRVYYRGSSIIIYMYIQKQCEVIYICFISVITCHSPDDGANSYIASQTGDVVNDEIHYNCNYGYHLTSGNLIRTCQINGTWDGNLPMCSRKYCSKPCSPYCNRENTFEWSCVYKGNNKITELRTILQRESQNS